ncbi:MAG: hypothetical protein ACTSP9_01635 [Promethearchaeota archaeon]
MSRDDYYSYEDYSYYGKDDEGRRGRRRTSRLTIFVIGITLFLLVFMPFYGITLRYYIGTSFRLVFDYLGNVFQTVGGLFLLFVVMVLFIHKRIWVKGMILGFLLLYMGAFLTGGTLVLFGMTVYQPGTIPGFH